MKRTGPIQHGHGKPVHEPEQLDLVVRGGKLVTPDGIVTAVSPVEVALALRVEAIDGKIVETKLPTTVLAGNAPIVKGPSS